MPSDIAIAFKKKNRDATIKKHLNPKTPAKHIAKSSIREMYSALLFLFAAAAVTVGFCMWHSDSYMFIRFKLILVREISAVAKKLQQWSDHNLLLMDEAHMEHDDDIKSIKRRLAVLESKSCEVHDMT
jgi:hypothetical protein